MSNENNNSGCFAIVLGIIAIVVVLYIVLGFFGNLFAYHNTGNIEAANGATIFLLLIVGVMGVVLYIKNN